MLKALLTILKSAVIAGFYAVLSATWRIKELGEKELSPKGNGKLYAHWHGDELLMLKMGSFRNMAVMASRSQDGELMKWVLKLLGFQVVRGSSSKGGAGGLKGLIDLVLEKNCHSSLAVDGPRGPIYEVKPGVLALSQKTGKKIVPTAGAARWRFVFSRAWNQCYFPMPFSKCVVIYGEPIEVSPTATEEEVEKARALLKERLIELKGQAEEKFHRTFLPAVRQSYLHGA